MLHEEGRAGSLSEGRAGSRGRARGVAYVVALPLGCCVQGTCAVPCFCSQLFRTSIRFFLSFSIFLSIICPSCPGMQLFLVRYSFFAFCCWRRCLSRYQHCSRGSQPFSGPNSIIMEQMLSDQASEMTTRRRFRGGQRASLVL